MEHSYKFFIGRKVFAKLKGYPPWPARIESITGKKAKVIFFGSGNQWAIVSLSKLSTITETDISKHYGKNKVFTKVIDEWYVASFENLKFENQSINADQDFNLNSFDAVKVKDCGLRYSSERKIQSHSSSYSAVQNWLKATDAVRFLCCFSLLSLFCYIAIPLTTSF